MKKDAFFVNMSRGNLVDASALAGVLASDHLARATMDVGRAPNESQALDTVHQVEALVKGEVLEVVANLKDWTRRG
jgi:D-3-phosphoglycerate dehydrogenase / 2-oxoglutarate reductase